ncbi:MAG: EFR1 family ferrodoxin [Eggerthellaceae bacterium]
MAKGETQSAAGLYKRVDLDQVLYTDNFTVNENCISCGHCTKICPAEAIKMVNDTPTWVKHKCFMCFGCLRLCPTEAIYYGGAEGDES